MVTHVDHRNGTASTADWVFRVFLRKFASGFLTHSSKSSNLLSFLFYVCCFYPVFRGPRALLGSDIPDNW